MLNPEAKPFVHHAHFQNACPDSRPVADGWVQNFWLTMVTSKTIPSPKGLKSLRDFPLTLRVVELFQHSLAEGHVLSVIELITALYLKEGEDFHNLSHRYQQALHHRVIKILSRLRHRLQELYPHVGNQKLHWLVFVPSEQGYRLYSFDCQAPSEGLTADVLD